MMPVNKYMDSYPHQRNLTGYWTFPTHMPMAMDPTKSPMAYEPWSYGGGNYGYPAPCHSCCNHSNFPGFHGFRPSYPQPMAVPIHHFGGYPTPYPEDYPVYYVPPSHYSMVLPRYEYDKNTPWNYHCCGCPNRPCHQKEDKTSMIQEQDPDDHVVVDKKGNDRLVPAQTKNYPYPIVWVPPEVPPEYLKEQRKPLEPEVSEQESVPSRTKPLESKNLREQEQNLWNGCYPLDMDKLSYLMRGGNEKRIQDQKNEEQKKEMYATKDQKTEGQMRQFPFPIVWMPPQAQEKQQEEDFGQESKEANGSPKFGENSPFTFKFVPVKHLGGDNNTNNNSKVNEENFVGQNGGEVKERTSTQKNIHVKQIDSNKEEVKSEENEKNNVTSKPISGTNGKRQSEASPKSSKLPPVCLRVDPLPKKKNGSGSSRSPSPPGTKGRCQECSNDTVKAIQDSKRHESTPSKSKEVEPMKKETKEIVVTEKMTGGNNEGEQIDRPEDSVHLSTHTNAKISEKPTNEKDGDVCQREDVVADKVGDAMSEETTDTKIATDSTKFGEEKKLENKTLLSDVEAAVRIQSAFRGFEVRRWEPLKKLKKIVEVREQVVDVRNRIQALESSSDVQNDEKQKFIIGEAIMRLLLKLDTIQGLHSSLRDIRKSLVKELVTLQEKLDSLMIEKLEKPTMEACLGQPVETHVSKDAKDECILKQERQKEMGRREISEDVPKSIQDLIESGQDQLLHAKGEETLPSLLENATLHIASEDERHELSEASSDLELKEPVSEAIVEQKDGVSNNEPEVCITDLMETNEVNNASELKQAGEVSLEEDKNDLYMPANAFESIDETCVETNLEVLPLEVTDESQKNKQEEMENAMVCGVGETESGVRSEVTLSDGFKGLMATERDSESEMNEMAELPLGIIDEDPTSSFQVEKNDDEPEKVSECQSTSETTSLEDKTTPIENEKTEEVLEEQPIAETEEFDKVGSQSEELQQIISLGQEKSQIALHEDGCELADTASFKEVLSEKNEENEEHLAVVTTEEGIKETQETKVGAMNDDQLEFVVDEKKNDKWDGSEITKEIMGSKNDMKLIEENQKLRKMMEKLIEAGKRQLNVISHLDGRVKDLEKKLSRRKKLRTKQSRSSPRRGTTRVKCSKSNVPVSVAM